MTKGFPELRQLYDMLGVQDRVICEPQTHFPHNYNYVTRAIMYRWFNKQMKLGLEEPIVEERWQPLTPEESTVWDEEHPKPASGEEYERALVKWLTMQSDRQIAALVPNDATSLAKYREVVGGAVRTLIHRELPPAGSIERKKIDQQDGSGFRFFKEIVRNTDHGEELPVLSMYPTATQWNREVVIWVDGRGKAAIFDSDGQPIGAVRRLVDGGASIVSGDLFLQGEFLRDGKPLTDQPVVKNPREFAGYTFTYNDTVFVRRVHDILTLVSFARSGEDAAEKVHLVGVNGAGPLVAAARAIAGSAVDRAAVDTQRFRFADLTSYRDPSFVPGMVKYGDLPALLALSAPHKLWIGGEKGDVPDVVAAGYHAANAANNVRSFRGPSSEIATGAVAWILSR